MRAAPYFDLVLTPNRSLDRRHARWIVLGVAAIMLLMGIRLLLLGAWPVIPFLVIDVALMAWAFRASYRSGRGYEKLRLDEDDLVVRRCSAEGRERHIRLEPLWTTARLERMAMRQNRLWLTAREQRVAVGRFLSPGEREEIYAVISDGLERYQRRIR